MKMIKDCRQGKIDLILTKSMSRFGRNTQFAKECVRVKSALTARGFLDTTKMKKVNGFPASGDDYTAKPFGSAEITARVASHLRRDERCHGTQRLV